MTEAHRLLHGGESAVWGDAGYQGAEKRPEHAGSEVQWRVAMRPGLRRQLLPGGAEAQAERRKASVRAKAEHPFLYVKRHFGYAKVRYRGLEKNRQRLALLLGFTNLLRAEPQLAWSRERCVRNRTPKRFRSDMEARPSPDRGSGPPQRSAVR